MRNKQFNLASLFIVIACCAALLAVFTGPYWPVFALAAIGIILSLVISFTLYYGCILLHATISFASAILRKVTGRTGK